jgi:adenosine deaminase
MDFKSIPKVELHRHLELSLRPSTIKELAPRIGISIPDEKTYQRYFVINKPMHDLGSVLNKFLDTQKLLATTEILERVTYEICEDAYKKENIHVLELRYAPTFIRQGHEDMSFDDIHQAIVKGMNRAMSDYPIAVGLICIIQRILPISEAEAVTQFAIDNKDTFIGLDLADNEVGFDCKSFSSFFLKAKEQGLGITVHGGEANYPGAPQAVADAIDMLGASRIGHGLQIVNNVDIMNKVKNEKVTLELCPKSNWLTNAVSSFDDHPFKILMDYGIRTTINSDDPGIFDTDLLNEYMILHDYFHLNEGDFKKCNQFAYEASFIDKTFIKKQTEQSFWN